MRNRTNLGFNSRPSDRLFDKKIEITASGTNQEGVFILEATFDTKNELSEVAETRREEIAKAARIRIQMWKRNKGQVLLNAKGVDLVLVEEKEGFHDLEPGKYLSTADLVKLAKKDIILIGVKEKLGNIVYIVSSHPLKKLVTKLAERVHKMSNEMESWKMDPYLQYDLDF